MEHEKVFNCTILITRIFLLSYSYPMENLLNYTFFTQKIEFIKVLNVWVFTSAIVFIYISVNWDFMETIWVSRLDTHLAHQGLERLAAPQTELTPAGNWTHSYPSATSPGSWMRVNQCYSRLVPDIKQNMYTWKAPYNTDWPSACLLT